MFLSGRLPDSLCWVLQWFGNAPNSVLGAAEQLRAFWAQSLFEGWARSRSLATHAQGRTGQVPASVFTERVPASAHLIRHAQVRRRGVIGRCARNIGRSGPAIRGPAGEELVLVTAAMRSDAAEKLVGRSPCMETLRARLDRLSDCDVNVLLEGESGTGKELAARMIHDASERRDGPFIGVNCAAIHETLLESELFGHEPGAFTGAGDETIGFLRAGDGGTILLDEVGDMSPSLQSKLLRVLEERAVTPVGGTRAIGIDVRVIAATHHDLLAAVEAGTFRRDLYYRLNVVRLQIEPLRQRRQDIPILADCLSGEIARAMDLPRRRISAAAMAALVAHDWPGNVRELGNVIQRAYVLSDSPVIEPDDLPEVLLSSDASSDRPTSRQRDTFPPLQQAVRAHVKRALELSGGIRTRAAELLGVDRKSLWRMIRRYEL